MTTVIFKDFSDFTKRKDKTVNGVSEDFAKENTDFENDNATNKGCWNCTDCTRCKSCTDCEGCEYFIRCAKLRQL